MAMGVPKFAGWLISMGKSHRSKWMMTGGSPMTQETSNSQENTMTSELPHFSAKPAARSASS